MAMINIDFVEYREGRGELFVYTLMHQKSASWDIIWMNGMITFDDKF